MGCGAACGTCSTSGGCGGGCKTGGCNRLNVYDWLSDITLTAEQQKFNIIEVSFKNGARKGFYRNKNHINCVTGDMVVVESHTGGYDTGRVSLMGELVRLQMLKKKVAEDSDRVMNIIRLAGERDMERFDEAKLMEHHTMLQARIIARHLALDMKIGDVEYQGDNRKATFYYTAEGRVDFRELIKLFAREFRVKIEMRQIGSRQEAGRIGGIGSCGRELCCSTWLTQFSSVSTMAARYQNLAINQSKLSGQCGRLKCCLNYELDSYLDALKDFPEDANTLFSVKGENHLIKTDIFKRKMWYRLPKGNTPIVLSVEKVKEVIAMNKRGERPEDLKDIYFEELELPSAEEVLENKVEDFVDAALSVDILEQKARRDKRRQKRKRNQEKRRNQARENRRSENKDEKEGKKPNSEGEKKDHRRKNRDKKPYSNDKKGPKNRSNNDRNKDQKPNRDRRNKEHQKPNDKSQKPSKPDSIAPKDRSNSEPNKKPNQEEANKKQNQGERKQHPRNRNRNRNRNNRPKTDDKNNPNPKKDSE